jgi:Domain of unknown function (DUF222)
MPTTASEPLVIPDLTGMTLLGDAEVMRLQSDLASMRRRVDAASAMVAGEIARRSAVDLGYTGLAQRLGARTPEKLVAQLSGMSAPEARAMVSVGESLGGEQPWLESVLDRVVSGEVSVGAAAAIRVGLGAPSDDVAIDDLSAAARRLAEESAGLSPEKAAAKARQARDDLDEAGVADREALLRGRRYLRLVPRADGMTQLFGLLDPESAALVTDAVDRVTMPRRGGVRFVDPAEQARAEAIVADARTTEQLALDALVHMVRIAGRVDDGQIFGERGPAVRAHVSLADLERRAGRGGIEGQTASVSIPTIERAICSVGLIPILFHDDGRSLKLGRTSRLFTQKQRIAMAARDGGCLIGGCDRPPSWCEAHHIDEWTADHGRTDVDDGVLLCRHHHMWVHDTGARVTRSGATYRVNHADGTVTALQSKSTIRHVAA